MNKRIAFFGGKPLSARCLRHLYQYQDKGEIEIVAVLPRPKGQTGWWSGPDVPEMYETAEELGLPILRDEAELLDIPCDLGYSVLHYRILPAEIVGHPSHGFLNLHGAPLPHYRGCNSYSHAIMNGETRYGATLHYMDPGVDSGPVIRVQWVEIAPDDTARSLSRKTEQASEELFCDTLREVVDNTIVGTPQKQIIDRDGVRSCFYLRNSLQQPGAKEIDLTWPPQKIYDHVRALDFPPWEPAHAMVNGQKVYLRTTY